MSLSVAVMEHKNFLSFSIELKQELKVELKTKRNTVNNYEPRKDLMWFLGGLREVKTDLASSFWLS